MPSYISQLADINKRLQDAVNQLREQQKLVSDIDCPRKASSVAYVVVQWTTCLLLAAKSTPQTYSELKQKDRLAAVSPKSDQVFGLI
jgi:hypothetical protein